MGTDRRDAERALSTLAVSAFLFLFARKIPSALSLYALDGWSTGDWLIHYRNGFIRRGLFGEAALAANGWFGIDPVLFAMRFKIGVYLAFALLFAGLIARKGIGAFEALLCLSPWFLMFPIGDAKGAGRKEILLLFAFLLYVLIGDFAGPGSRRLWRRWDFWYMACAFPLLVLAHEGLIFFLHFFLLHAAFRKGAPAREEVLSFLGPYGAAWALVLLMRAFFNGSDAAAAALCGELLARGVPASLCSGSISSLGAYEFRIDADCLRNFIPIAALTLLPLCLYAASALRPGKPGRIWIGAAAAVLPSLPLFLLASDWGRWIHTLGTLAFVSILAAKRAPGLAWSWDTPLARFFLLVTPWLYLFKWRILHFAPPGAGSFWQQQSLGRWMESLL